MQTPTAGCYSSSWDISPQSKGTLGAKICRPFRMVRALCRLHLGTNILVELEMWQCTDALVMARDLGCHRSADQKWSLPSVGSTCLLKAML